MDVLTRNWGWVALRGVLAIIFGLILITRPVISLASLILFFGAFAFIDGIFTVITAIADRRGEPHWVALLISGLVGIAAGVVTFLMPGITALVLLYCIAGWAIITGIMGIITAIRLRKLITGEWLLILAGLFSVVFGLYLFMAPGAGALAIVIWIGAYAIISGVMLVVLGFRLRSWGRHPVTGTGAPA